jgi:hypothetical protein
MGDLRVELLYTIDCPGWEGVRRDLVQVIGEGSIETPIELIQVNSQDDAEFLDFHGSPTVRMNGLDVVPTPPGSPAGLACRLYEQPDGTRAGRVPIDLLRAAIRDHRQGRLSAFQREESARVAAASRDAATDDEPGGAAGRGAGPRL